MLTQQHDAPIAMLSVRQPWADFLAPDDGVAERLRDIRPDLAEQLPKNIENRGYRTSHRGLTAIHAPARPDLAAMERYGLDPRAFVYSAVVGVVSIDGVTRGEDDDAFWAQHGQIHWQVAAGRRLLSPILCPGFLGVRAAEPAIARQIRSALARELFRTLERCSV